MSLRVPGVIGVVLDPAPPRVEVGVDAGWPRFQPMDQWKGEPWQLVERASIDHSAAEAAGIVLAEIALATMSDEEARWQELQSTWGGTTALHGERAMQTLRLRARQRLIALDAPAATSLRRQGIPVWGVGYSRHREQLRVVLPGHAGEIVIGGHDVPIAVDEGRLPPQIRLAAAQALCRAVWFDRVLRALSDGAITELAVQAALAAHTDRPLDEVVDDDVARAGAEAAARVTACAAEVEIPRYGTAYRVHLPAILVGFETEGPDGPLRARLPVAAEDRWILAVSPDPASATPPLRP